MAPALLFVLVGAPVEGAHSDALVSSAELRGLPPGIPAAVELEFIDTPADNWPEALRETLRSEIVRTWPARLAYGPVETALGVSLAPPLALRSRSGFLQIPVVEAAHVDVVGRLERPDHAGPKRVVIAVDASQSANARTSFQSADGTVEQISVLEAELRALTHLVDRLEDEWLEVGILAFGEQTELLAKPGASVSELRAALARFAREHPEGEGRTDTICALWSAVDWLRDSPREVSREIVLLTDGDFPHSGRFVRCDGLSPGAKRTCEERRNEAPCPAKRRLDRGGRSDLVQLARFAGDSGRKVRVSPLVFASDRSARVYRKLAQETQGQFVQVPSAGAIERVLPSLVRARVRGVHARNLTTGERSSELLAPDRMNFRGALPLAPGANDLELRVEGERGLLALHRVRVFGASGFRAAFLSRLRERNGELESELIAREREENARRARTAAGRSRSLEIVPASPESPL